MSESNKLLDYGHLTPGRPCFVPPRFVRSPAFNPFRPFPHFDLFWNPVGFINLLFAKDLALRAAIPRAAAAIFVAAVFPPATFLNRPFLALRGGVPVPIAGRSTAPPLR
jgi:hypothetical protein